MIKILKAIFSAIFVFMVYLTIKTSFESNLFETFPLMLKDPWTVATLWDTYFGFLTIYLWVFYKESTTLSRTIWFVLVMTLGNIAISFYILIQLFKLPSDSSLESLLLKRGS